MTAPQAEPVLDSHGPAAPPRRNGELALDEPWQGRLFGVTMALCRSGAVDHERFRQQLIAEIALWEAEHPNGGGYSYWDRWQAALEAVLERAAILDVATLTALAAELAARPAGHDHAHPHQHVAR